MPTENTSLNFKKELAEALASIMQQVQLGMAEASKVMNDAISSTFPSLFAAVETFQRLPAEVRPTMLALLQRGWFFSGYMGFSELIKLTDLNNAGDFQQVDLYMQNWIENELDLIKNRFCNAFPKRAGIISEAFSAHVSGQYALSIPVFLIQAEGICVDTLGVKLFSTSHGIPQTRSATDQWADNPLSEALLLPIREISGVTATNTRRPDFPHSPNRHEILHGIDTDYATLTNSLKVISLLDYFVTLVATRNHQNANIT